MESKVIKSLLIAILAVLVLLLIPTWGLFLSGLNNRSAGNNAPEAGTPITSESDANDNAPVSGMAVEPTKEPLKQASILGEPDAEGWVQVSLPFFKEPVMAKATMKGPHVAYITVRVSQGMEIMTPGPCLFHKNTNAYAFSRSEEYWTENGREIRLESEGGIDAVAESGFTDISGHVLGTFKSDGEATIMTPGIKPQEIGQTDIAAWYNTVMEILLGE